MSYRTLLINYLKYFLPKNVCMYFLHTIDGKPLPGEAIMNR